MSTMAVRLEHLERIAAVASPRPPRGERRPMAASARPCRRQRPRRPRHCRTSPRVRYRPRPRPPVPPPTAAPTGISTTSAATRDAQSRKMGQPVNAGRQAVARADGPWSEPSAARPRSSGGAGQACPGAGRGRRRAPRTDMRGASRQEARTDRPWGADDTGLRPDPLPERPGREIPDGQEVRRWPRAPRCAARVRPARPCPRRPCRRSIRR